MIVLKFGGSSIQSAEAINRVVQIVKGRIDSGLIVVCSAIGDTTDHLVSAAEESLQGKIDEAHGIINNIRRDHNNIISAFFSGEEKTAISNQMDGFFSYIHEMIHGISTLKDFSPPVQDYLLSHGELLSSTIMNAIFRSVRLPSVFIDARDCLITDVNFTRATPDLQETARKTEKQVLPLLEGGYLPVIPGFIGSTISGRPTTLGRGGSDYTASVLGAVLQVQEVQLWTDVNGIMTADPSLVKEAMSIDKMSFQEAAELAYFGAKVLHPKTLIPAMESGIPVRVLNTYEPESQGTIILPEAGENGTLVKSIAYKENTTLATIVSSRMFKAHSFLRKVFKALDELRIAADLVATTEVSVALALTEPGDLEKLKERLRNFGKVAVHKKRAIVCVVGEHIRNHPGIAGRIFSTIPDVPISMISEGGSEINISFVCHEKDLGYVINRLHREFFPHIYQKQSISEKKAVMV